MPLPSVSYELFALGSIEPWKAFEMTNSNQWPKDLRVRDPLVVEVAR